MPSDALPGDRRARAVAALKPRSDSQKSKLAKAIRYALSRWEGLTRFIEDGRIELDNNTVERSIRPRTRCSRVPTEAPSIGLLSHP